MRLVRRVLLATLLAASAHAVEVPADGWVDPPQRPDYFPSGPLRVVGGITAISAINANDALGNSPLEFQQVTIRGVVQLAPGSLDPFDRPQPTPWFYVHDGTGGMAVAWGAGLAVPLAAGDSVQVTTFVLTQPLAPRRGTRTLDYSAVGLGSFTSLGTGRPLRATQTVTAAEVAAGAALEGNLVSVTGLTLVDPSEWPSLGNSGFVRATDGTGTLRIYIDEDTSLDGSSPPADGFRVSGWVGQDDPPPYAGGYYVYPRSVVTVTPDAVIAGETGLSLQFRFTANSRLDQVELAIPAAWDWATPGDLALSGAGFSGATSAFVPAGGGWTITITGATLDAARTGTLTISSLTAPSTGGLGVLPLRTAELGGSLAPACTSPSIRVSSAGSPGDVVINELYPRTTTAAQGVERSEFIELRNRTAEDLDLEDWTLADIGRTPGCELGSRWAFPPGATIPANGFVVVCQTARDPAPQNGGGFLVDFPGTPAAVYEMFDPTATSNRPDDAATPNMVLVDATAGDDRIYLLGGPDTNVGQCDSPNLPGLLLPSNELVVLRNTLGEIIDAVEYREPGPCTTDLCGPSDSAGTGADDAYPYGAPKVFHTLGRDAASTDTDDSSADLRPSSTPTPGAVNVPFDTVPPELLASSALSASIVEIRFDEPLEASLALDPARYLIERDPGRGPAAVASVLADPTEPLTHFFLLTDPLDPGEAFTLDVTGLTDIAFDGEPGNGIDTSFVVNVPPDAFAICDVQAADEVGFSPLVGDTVLVAGFVTILPTSVDRFSIWVQEPGAEGCGVNVFSFDIPAELGIYGLDLNDLVVIHGRVTEFVSSSSGAGAVTELASFGNTDFFRFLVRGLPGPEPRVKSTGDAGDESLEGTLVRTEGTVVNANALAAWIDDGTGSVQVFQNFSALDLTRFKVGDRLNVTGVITQFDSSEPFFDGYELVPQNQDAIILVPGDFSSSPSVHVGKRVLVPDLGERMDISVNAPQRHDVIVEIYDPQGRKVTTLYDGLGLGEMRFEWDGRSQNGGVVSPGVYLCHVRATPLDGGSVVTHTAPIVVGLRLEGGGAAR